MAAVSSTSAVRSAPRIEEAASRRAASPTVAPRPDSIVTQQPPRPLNAPAASGPMLRAPAPTPRAATASARNTKPDVVIVQAGDSLSEIAARHGVSLPTLRRANPELFRVGLDRTGHLRATNGSRIYPGDEVLIPVPHRQAATTRAQAVAAPPKSASPKTVGDLAARHPGFLRVPSGLSPGEAATIRERIARLPLEADLRATFEVAAARGYTVCASTNGAFALQAPGQDHFMLTQDFTDDLKRPPPAQTYFAAGNWAGEGKVVARVLREHMENGSDDQLIAVRRGGHGLEIRGVAVYARTDETTPTTAAGGDVATRGSGASTRTATAPGSLAAECRELAQRIVADLRAGDRAGLDTLLEALQNGRSGMAAKPDEDSPAVSLLARELEPHLTAGDFSDPNLWSYFKLVALLAPPPLSNDES